jgi:hypothetical protein
MPVIPSGPGPAPTILSFAGAAGPHPQWGDIATWATAVVALGALVAAAFAYRKQADAARDLSRQVGLQSDQLKDQQEATRQQAEAVSQLAEQARIQREQLKDQQEANAKQAQVLDAQLREIQQRAEAIERQQASAITLARRHWILPIGVREEGGSPVHMAVVENGSGRPIRNVVCRIRPTGPDDLLHEAYSVGRMVNRPPGAFLRRDEQFDRFEDEAQGTKLSLIRAGERGAFVFIYEIANYAGLMVLRFTDDAGLHWQIDHDLHLENLDSRDDW